MPTDSLPNATMPGDLGHRLRAVRRERHICQAEAAAMAGLARTTLISIEKGNREVRVRELQLLAGFYGVSTEDLLRPQAVFSDIVPRCRALGLFADRAVEAAVRLVAGLATAEAELEIVLGIPHVTNYPVRRPLLRGNVQLQAEQDAGDLRDWLGFAATTVPDMPTLLAGELGMRIFERPLAAYVHGMFVFDETVGACAIVNAALPRRTRRFVAAFLLACLVAVREEVGVLLDQPGTRTRGFRYADAFARAFLMPARTVMQQFKTLARPGAGLGWPHIVALSAAFDVAPRTLVRRLEDLKLTLPRSWARFEAEAGAGAADAGVGAVDSEADAAEPDAGAADAEADTAEPEAGAADAEAGTNTANIGAGAGPERDPPASGRAAPVPPPEERLYQLVAAAWRRGLMTDARLGALLYLDRPAMPTTAGATVPHLAAEAAPDAMA